MRLRHELTISRAPEDVFAFLGDPRNLPAWQHSVERVTAPPEIAVGTRFTEERSRIGRTFRSTLEVVELEQDRLLTIEVVDGPVAARIRHELQPAPEGTLLRVEAEGDFERVPWPLRSLIVRTIEGELGRDFAALKGILERPPAHSG